MGKAQFSGRSGRCRSAGNKTRGVHYLREKITRNNKGLRVETSRNQDAVGEIALDLTWHAVVSFGLMEIGAEIMATKKAPERKVGRPKAAVKLRPVSINFDPEILAAIERARLRRQKANPGMAVTMSDAVRALVLKAVAAEEGAEPQAELPLTLLSTESTTKKS